MRSPMVILPNPVTEAAAIVSALSEFMRMCAERKRRLGRTDVAFIVLAHGGNYGSKWHAVRLTSWWGTADDSFHRHGRSGSRGAVAMCEVAVQSGEVRCLQFSRRCGRGK